MTGTYGFKVGDRVVVVDGPTRKVRNMSDASFTSQTEGRIGSEGKITQFDRHDPHLPFLVQFTEFVREDEHLWVGPTSIQLMREDET